MLCARLRFVLIFFFNDPATTEIYTLSLHDALPIWDGARAPRDLPDALGGEAVGRADSEQGEDRLAEREHEREERVQDRKSTRLNSSHSQISYAVFCLKKKKKKNQK